MSFNFDADFDQQEARRYRPGTRLELKHSPSLVDIIAEYDPMMVPPIWLANDPQPRYPQELKLLARPIVEVAWLPPLGQRKVPARVSLQRNTSAKQKASCTHA